MTQRTCSDSSLEPSSSSPETPALQRVLRLCCPWNTPLPFQSEDCCSPLLFTLLLRELLWFSPPSSLNQEPLCFICLRLLKRYLLQRSRRRGWGGSLGGGGDGRGEGQSPFKFTNPRVGMTGSCPLGGGGFSHPHDGAKLTFYSWF